MNKKVLVFDIYGRYAHFKKPYTTTSPLTYSIPSRTVLTGIIGAIIGMEKNENNVKLDYSHCKFALEIINPIKKCTINQNLINTKVTDSIFRMRAGKSPRTQVKIEYLKDVKYRVYIEIGDKKIYNELKHNLENHLSFYTCSLGLSENIGNFKYVSEYDYLEQHGDALIDSVINLESVGRESIVIDIKKEYFTDRFPLEMKEDREITKYGDILFERCGESISVKNVDFLRVEDGRNIIWY